MIKQAAKVLGKNVALLKRVRIYLQRRFSGQKLKDIGIHFGIGAPMPSLIFLYESSNVSAASHPELHPTSAFLF